MKIVFTLCSNNYLAQAKTLGDSLIKHNPSYTFIIGLVDEYSIEIDYKFFEPFTIIPAAQLEIHDFDTLWLKYNIIELNTCLKASYFKYIFKNYKEANSVIYLDPDIVVYHSLSILENAFIENDLLITPHVISPIEIDGKLPVENLFLNYGLYNLGFLGVHRKCCNKNNFLDWWEKRTLTLGFNDTANGIFVDQLYINFIPIFYNRVKVLKNLGLNAAPWNLHERSVIVEDEGLKMSDNSPLFFYHFSSYRVDQPNKMSKNYTRYDFDTHPELKGIYASYLQALLTNKIDVFSKILCIYSQRRTEHLLSKIIVPTKKEIIYHKIKSAIKQFVPPILLKLKSNIN